MTQARSVKIYIKGSPDTPVTDGEIKIQEWNKHERILRAIKLGGMCWAMGLVAVLFPLLHFILVPGFLLAGPIVAFVVLGKESVILGGMGTCPYCQKPLPIARSAHRFPMPDLCTACHREVMIDVAPLF